MHGACRDEQLAAEAVRPEPDLVARQRPGGPDADEEVLRDFPHEIAEDDEEQARARDDGAIHRNGHAGSGEHDQRRHQEQEGDDGYLDDLEHAPEALDAKAPRGNPGYEEHQQAGAGRHERQDERGPTALR